MTARIVNSSWVLVLALLGGACGEDKTPVFVYDLDGTPSAEADAAASTASGESVALAFAADGLEVEAACGTCQFGMQAEGCPLAIRVGGIEGVAWLVDGTDIDDHGDAHAADGFCNTVRKAVVSGKVSEGRFVATSFELVD